MTELAPDNVAAYARQRRLIDGEARVEILSGGVACGVFRLHTTQRILVIKQAQPRFRVKEEWLVDPRRNLLEARMQALAREALGVERVPAVLDIDAENCAYAMESAPLDAKNWKTMLLAGDVPPELGQQCRQLLHKFQAIEPPAFLRDKTLFYQQRIEPYFEFTASRHPDVAGELTVLADRLMSSKEAVTHGDFTPKNFLVAGDTLILLDYEVAHLGWPEFDIVSLLNHLTLKTIHLPTHQQALRAMVKSFLAGHEPNLRLLGALMLARVDGKSPVEYLRENDKARVRELAKRLLRGEFASYEAFQAGAF